jgi:hypothetical protein
MMTSRPTAENPTAKDYRVPADPGRTGTPGPTVPMVQPRVIDADGTNIAGTGQPVKGG